MSLPDRANTEAKAKTAKTETNPKAELVTTGCRNQQFSWEQNSTGPTEVVEAVPVNWRCYIELVRQKVRNFPAFV